MPRLPEDTDLDEQIPFPSNQDSGLLCIHDPILSTVRSSRRRQIKAVEEAKGDVCIGIGTGIFKRIGGYLSTFSRVGPTGVGEIIQDGIPSTVDLVSAVRAPPQARMRILGVPPLVE